MSRTLGARTDAPRWDVLTLGDATTDIFIRLSGAHVRIREEDGERWIDLPFGGKVPFDYALTVDAGGNAANAAVGMARLGLSVAIAAHAGSDQAGRDMQRALDREGVDTHLVRFDPGRPSNRNFVLWYAEDRTIFVHHEIYDYHWHDLSPREIPRWVYLSSVGSDATEYYDQIVGWLDRHPAVQFAFQPGTFQIEQGAQTLREVYRRARVIVCNREEAVAIGGADHGDVGAILDSLHQLGPTIVVVTDGPSGAYASDGRTRLRMPCYPDPVRPVERTGAGDAFAAAFVAALVKGHPVEVAFAWAPINAMSVVQEVGSQTGLLSEPEILGHLKNAPESFVVTTW
jgi:sugar/nucleoside kinase (ribokinase family)